MTIKDLFRVIIKLFGVYLIISYFFQCLQLISMYSISFYEDFEWWQVALIILSFIVLFSLLSILVFLPDKIINLLRFDKGFDVDEKMKLGNLNIKYLISFAIVLVGGYLLVENFSYLLVSFGYYFRSLANQSVFGDIPQMLSDEHLYISIVKFAVGFLLLANYHKIAIYLTRNKNIEE